MIHDDAIFVNIKPDLPPKKNTKKKTIKLNNSDRHQTCSSLLPFAKSKIFHGSQASSNLGAGGTQQETTPNLSRNHVATHRII